MKRRIAVFVLMLNIGQLCHAHEDLTLQTNRDILEKMPLLTLQPMLDFCRDKQPQLNVELEQAYAGAKEKVLKAAKEGVISVRKQGVATLQEQDLNLPIAADFKQQSQEMLIMMSRSLQQLDAATYCPVLIQRLNQFDQHAFQQTLELQYKAMFERVEAQRKATQPQ